MAEIEREHIRLQMDTEVYVELAAAAPEEGAEAELLRCDVKDVSRGGLKAQVEQELIEHSILSIAVFIPGVDEPFHLVGEVRWCMPAPDAEGKWNAGFKVLSSKGSDIESWQDLLTHV
jgi:hypothetical protein